MVVELWIGIVLTALAWVGLLIAAAHGKYVTDKIAAGEYNKGPISEERDQ